MSEYVASSFKALIPGNTWIALKTTNELNCTRYDTIWVTQLPAPEFQFSLANNSEVGESTSLYVYGDNGLSYTWGSGEEGSLTSVEQSGWYVVTARNFDGCTTTDSVFITITGIEEQLATKYFKAYPNPTTGILYIEANTKVNSPGLSQVIIYNSKGEIVSRQNYDDVYTTLVHLNMRVLPRGMYFISLVDKKQNRTVFKILVQ